MSTQRAYDDRRHGHIEAGHDRNICRYDFLERPSRPQAIKYRRRPRIAPDNARTILTIVVIAIVFIAPLALAFWEPIIQWIGGRP